MAAPQQLKLFSSRRFTSPVAPDAISSSPVIDLVAAATNDSFLTFWRPEEHLVTRQYEKGATIQTVKWKPDGNFVAAGYSDGLVRMIALDSLRVVTATNVHPEGSEGSESSKVITCLACVHNLAGQRHLKRRPQDKESWKILLSDVEEPNKDGEDDALLAIPDLPEHLTYLEIDTALPKLSTLPMSGGQGEAMYVFSARQFLDYLFPPLHLRDINAIDVTAIGTQDGRLHLTVYSMYIGCFDIASDYRSPRKLPDVSLCHHASHPEVSTHSLLLRPQNGELDALYLVPMDLQFVSYSPVNLPLIAYKLSTLHQLVKYVKQTYFHLKNEYLAMRELPSRFLQNINEDLQLMPGGPVNIVQALYHTVVTGHVYQPVKEWLVDSLAERGHKRWDKAVMEGLINIRALVHENMLPGLERCSLVLSRLLGIARFHDSGESIGFTSTQIQGLIDFVSGLTFISHKILLIVMEELELFAVFSSWLRFMIDQLASSSGSEELSEKEATMDNAKVLTYIQKYLMKSPLALFLEPPTPEELELGILHLADTIPSLLDLIDKHLKKRQAGEPCVVALTSLGLIADRFLHRSAALADEIEKTVKRTVRFGPQPTKIGIEGEKISKYDARMCSVRRTDGIDGLTYTAIMLEEYPGDLFIFRTSIPIVNGVSGAVMTTVCGLSIQGGTLVDFKFLNDDTLLALWYPEGKLPVLLQIPLSASHMSYSPVNDEPLDVSIAHAHRPEMNNLSPLTLPDDPNFAPFRMEIKAAATAKGDIPVRICLLGRDKVTYKTFTLPDNTKD